MVVLAAIRVMLEKDQFRANASSLEFKTKRGVYNNVRGNGGCGGGGVVLAVTCKGVTHVSPQSTFISNTLSYHTPFCGTE